MKFLWVVVVLGCLEKKTANGGIFGGITSVFTDLASEVTNVADSAFGGVVSTFQEAVGTPAKLEEIKFYLFTLQNIAEPIILNPENPLSLAGGFGKIFFVLHGRRESSREPWVVELTNKLLHQYPDSKVVQVDWKGPASQNYAFAVNSTESIGKHVADVITRLTEDLQVPLKNVVLIGFSLGAQICGFAGKSFTNMTRTKLPKIVALDPAGVLFVSRPANKKLNRNDAESVHVIHTDGGKIGLTEPCGTIDFYPNGGKDQPGCPLVDISNIEEGVNCDHVRAYQYFIESVQNWGSFAAKQCLTAEELEAHLCSGSQVAMGNLDTTQTGVFFLKTNAQVPFSTSKTDDALIAAVFNGQEFAFPLDSLDPRGIPNVRQRYLL